MSNTIKRLIIICTCLLVSLSLTALAIFGFVSKNNSMVVIIKSKVPVKRVLSQNNYCLRPIDSGYDSATQCADGLRCVYESGSSAECVKVLSKGDECDFGTACDVGLECKYYKTVYGVWSTSGAREGFDLENCQPIEDSEGIKMSCQDHGGKRVSDRCVITY